MTDHVWVEREAAYRDTAYQYHRLFWCDGCGVGRTELYPEGVRPKDWTMGPYTPWDGTTMTCEEVIAKRKGAAEIARLQHVEWQKKRDAFLATHPRGFYWVKAESGAVHFPHGEMFVAFFHADPLFPRWLYPGESDEETSRGFAEPTILSGPIADNEEILTLDALIEQLWLLNSMHGNMTCLRAFGRRSICPGDPDVLAAVLNAEPIFRGRVVLCKETDGSTSIEIEPTQPASRTS